MTGDPVVGLDADDTLWRSEDHFRRAEELFLEWVGPFTPDGVDLAAALRSVELGNIAVSGYGVKAFGLSMVEAAVTATQGAVPSSVLAPSSPSRGSSAYSASRRAGSTRGDDSKPSANSTIAPRVRETHRRG